MERSSLDLRPAEKPHEPAQAEAPPWRAGTQKYLTALVGIEESGQRNTASPLGGGGGGAESHSGWTAPCRPLRPIPLAESPGVTGAADLPAVSAKQKGLP